MKKRFIIFTLILPLLLLAACSKNGDTLGNLSEMELAAGQTLVTGQVTSRVGNDIELALGTLAFTQGFSNAGEVTSGDIGAMPSGDRAMPSGMPSGDGAMPSGGPENGGGFSGERPDRSDASVQAADGTTTDGTATDGTTNTASGSQIQLSGETLSLTIPVGTRVLVTSNGTLTVSSFGRIQADDILQLILKTQEDGTQIVIEAQIME